MLSLPPVTSPPASIVYLVKVGDDFVEQSQALHAFVVGLQFHIELRKVANGGEHDGHTLAGLVVELVVPTLAGQEVRRHIFRQDVVKEAAVIRLQLLHLLLLLCGLGMRGLHVKKFERVNYLHCDIQA